MDIDTLTSHTDGQPLLFPRKDALWPRIPPAELERQVLGNASPTDNFLYGGYVVAEGLQDALRLIGRPIDTFRSVLDFGCGSARVLRWLHPQTANHVRLTGSDISREAIEWDRQNIPFAEFFPNDAAPPLPFADESFDFIFGVSVVAHLPEDSQIAWLQELRRILKPGGVLIMTVHGDDVSAWHVPSEHQSEYRKRGFVYRKIAEGGIDGLPDFYQVAYHSQKYVEAVWSQFFEVRGYLKHGPMYLQDLVLMEKAGPKPESQPYVTLDLPICALDSPKIAQDIVGDSLAVSGWGFHPRGGRVQFDLWIDDVKAGSQVADEPRLDVGQVFPAWAAAKASGFSATLPIAGLAEGPHRLRLRSGESTMACLSNYFFRHKASA